MTDLPVIVTQAELHRHFKHVLDLLSQLNEEDQVKYLKTVINPLKYSIVQFITPKEQWNAAIFSTAILLGTNIPWVGRGEKSAWRHTVSMQISLNLHNLCKSTKIFFKNIILLKRMSYLTETSMEKA